MTSFSFTILFKFADRGVQMAGYFDHQTGKFVYVEEMEPELVVPDLTDFQVYLKDKLVFIVYFPRKYFL